MAVVNGSIKIHNDEAHDSLIDIRVETYDVIERIFLYMRLNVPENSNDKDFKKELFRFTFEVAKLFKDGYTNFMSKILMERLRETVDFELKFPFKKVSTGSNFIDCI